MGGPWGWRQCGAAARRFGAEKRPPASTAPFAPVRSRAVGAQEERVRNTSIYTFVEGKLQRWGKAWGQNVWGGAEGPGFVQPRGG